MEQAHQKNLFLKKIKSAMGMMGCKSAFDLLDHETIDTIYYFRLRPIKILASGPDLAHISSKELAFLNQKLHILFINAYVEFDEPKFKINLYDYYCYIETIYLFWHSTKPSEFRNA